MKTGGCLCGAVRFTAQAAKTVSICHCEKCRRWSGSAFVEASVPNDDLTWTGADHIATRRTSDWAERAWCRACGSPLYYKHLRDDEWFGSTELPIGIFDDPNGFTLTHEIFIDEKPDSFCFAGTHRKLTRADCVAKYPALDSDR